MHRRLLRTQQRQLIAGYKGTTLVPGGDYWLHSRGLDLKASKWEERYGAWGGNSARGAEGADYPGGPRRRVPARNVGRPGGCAREVRVRPKPCGNGASKQLPLCRPRERGCRSVQIGRASCRERV